MHYALCTITFKLTVVLIPIDLADVHVNEDERKADSTAKRVKTLQDNLKTSILDLLTLLDFHQLSHHSNHKIHVHFPTYG